MQIPDLINGVFELTAGILLWVNVYRLYQDKKVRGISVFVTLFFACWGYWNIFYYPHLNQWLSFFGGLSVTIANSVWVGQMIYYTRKEKKLNEDFSARWNKGAG